MQPGLLTGVAALANKYDYFVLDLWGTLHDGVQPLPNAVECLTQLRKTSCRIGILSNAPRRAEIVEQSMNRIGIPTGLYDFVWSSGEEAWQAIAHRPDDWYRSLGRRCFHIGPNRDSEMLNNPGLDRVDDLADADFVLCTGLERSGDTLADYAPILQAVADRGLKMVCANPDLVVLRAGRREFCGGTLGTHYENDLGGDVRWHGKPHRPTLENCLAKLGATDASRAVMVGDALRTDIAAASAAGAASILLLGGIHADELGIEFGQAADPARLKALCAEVGHTPDHVLPAFVWD